MTIEERIDALARAQGVPYLDVCAYKDHQPVFRHFTGDGVNGREMLWMYSCTKPVTVALAMRLVEEGKLALTDPVSKYLPEYANVFLLRDGKPCPPSSPITVWHLFTMSAGFSYSLDNDAVREVVEKSGGLAPTRDVVAAFVKNPLLFEPGERFNYSLCHDILAAVTEVCAGEAFSSYAKRVLFDPVGMTSSTFDPTGVSFAPQYTYQHNVLEPVDTSNPFIPTKHYDSGGAGLISCVSDYARFADVMACGGTTADGYRFLKEKTIRTIQTLQNGKFVHPESFSCIQGPDYEYGLGVRVRTKATEWGLGPGEFGWDGAAGSYMMADPNRHISVAMGLHVLYWTGYFAGKHLEIVKDLYETIFNA